MKIVLKPEELVNIYIKSTSVECKISNVENEFTISLEPSAEKNMYIEYETTSEKQLIKHEMTSEEQLIDDVQTPTQVGNSLKYGLSRKMTLPTIEDVKEYIRSKENYIHDNIEIQEYFFDRPLNSRKEPQLYNKLIDTIRKARYEIAEEDNGVWKSDEFRKTKENKHTKVNEFVKKLDIAENKFPTNNEPLSVEN